MSVYVFRSRGATEPLGRASMCGHVTDRLKHLAVIEDIPHSASISINNASRDPLAPSGENCATYVVDWLNRRVAKLGPNDVFIVLGHSLGAVGTTRWLKQYTPLPGGPRCLMVGHIANPSRKETTSYGLPYTKGASGIYATQGTGTVSNTMNSPVPLVEIANPLDVMTTCYAVSPLHAFAGPVMAFSFARPTDLIADLQKGGIDAILMNVANSANWFNPRWWAWMGELHAFMTGGVHTSAYGQPMWRDSAGKPVSGVELLARQANWRISAALKEAHDA